MDSRLKFVAEAGDINLFYTLMAEDPCLLDNLDDIPFVETPMHASASFGHTEFAAEMMRLKPSFARKPNPQGYTPLHVALQNGAIDTVRELVYIDPQLIGVKGREGMTPLHFAAENGDMQPLKDFLLACPDSITQTTVRNETALHIAVKNRRYDAFNVLIGWLRKTVNKGSFDREVKILNMKDIDGNTVLHIAVQTNQPQVVRVLLGCMGINSKNKKGLTPLDISELQIPAQNEINTMLRHAGGLNATAISVGDHRLSSKLSFLRRVQIDITRTRKDMSDGMVNVMLVLAVLVLTAVYQSVLSPPGGLWQGESNSISIGNTTTVTNTSSITHQPGTSIMSSGPFNYFLFLNMIMLLYAMLVIIFLLLDHLSFNLILMPLLYVFFLCFGF